MVKFLKFDIDDVCVFLFYVCLQVVRGGRSSVAVGAVIIVVVTDLNKK